jgi:hypothetical protein
MTERPRAQSFLRRAATRGDCSVSKSVGLVRSRSPSGAGRWQFWFSLGWAGPDYWYYRIHGFQAAGLADFKSCSLSSSDGRFQFAPAFSFCSWISSILCNFVDWLHKSEIRKCIRHELTERASRNGRSLRCKMATSLTQLSEQKLRVARRSCRRLPRRGL